MSNRVAQLSDQDPQIWGGATAGTEVKQLQKDKVVTQGGNMFLGPFLPAKLAPDFDWEVATQPEKQRTDIAGVKINAD